MQLPDQMTAVEITAPGEPGVLKAAQRDMPKVGPDEVLIEVAAAGRQPARRVAAAGHVSAAARHDGHTGARDRRHGRRGRQST